MFTADDTFNGGGSGDGFLFVSTVCDDAGVNDVPAQVDVNCMDRADNVSGNLGVQRTLLRVRA